MSAVITESGKMTNIGIVTKIDVGTNLVTKEITTGTKSVRKRRSTIAVGVDAITGNQTRTAKSTREEDAIATEMMKGTTTAGSVKSKQIHM